ncbi:MAG: DNA/RNA non-specific endonuclease [Treponema sp.]|nr:DNA/RNA non-specific endonuclease [Treponema sp.]
MSARRKSNKNNNFSLFSITKLLLLIVFLIALIFAVDYCSVKTNTKNAATEKIHDTKESIQEIAQEVLNEVVPRAEAPVKEVTTEVSKKTVPPPAPLVIPENLEIPLCKGTETGITDDHQIRHFGNFTICYRESYEQAEWAAYCLEKEELVKNSPRSNNFRPDPEIMTGSASLADYRKSGYDRGHLAPAADFSFSEEAMSESFYLSNMSPQDPSLNREIWQYLENQVREWAKVYGKVYVVTGPILEKPAEEYEAIGPNQVSVPEYFYKALMAPQDDSLKAIGFIIPNRKCVETFWDFTVSIDEIEKRTGLDFFYLLDNSLENILEAKNTFDEWK